MSVKNLNLTACQVGEALNICETAASRKVGEAESFITDIMSATEAITKTGRPDRVRTAVIQKLRTVAALEAAHPEKFEAWITSLLSDSRKSPPAFLSHGQLSRR